MGLDYVFYSNPLRIANELIEYTQKQRITEYSNTRPNNFITSKVIIDVSMVECLLCMQEASGSIPDISTFGEWIVHFFNPIRSKVNDHTNDIFNCNNDNSNSNNSNSNNSNINNSNSNNSNSNNSDSNNSYSNNRNSNNNYSNNSNSNNSNSNNSNSNNNNSYSIISNVSNSIENNVLFNFLLGGRSINNSTREWKDLFKCQMKSGAYSDIPFLVVTAAPLQSIIPIAIGSNRIVLLTTKSVNAEETVRQSSKASATNEDHNFVS
ncbi:hypothetical protein H8356DRAFT_1350732 [Neocallimastix lanati (nom. inval.)]|nr:hypothetical protein H8356DRAFT_1350732 [Neocallimastix sp. JGI-2020a]